ncbi:MAG TPA: peptidylprolyl isomerase [Bacteroidaceae bacterium]|nr:peptidylprolyl isomerase [Bacteroidaceae bacterium]
MNFARSIITVMIVSGFSLFASGQDNQFILDRVVAVVGDFTILQSDIEQEYLQMKMSGMYTPPDTRCRIFNNYVNQKLLMAQAKIDSVEVSPDQVEMQINSRMDYFLSQFGSEEEMEDYFSKSILDIKEDMREAVREMMITQEVQSSIIADVSTTPSDVKSFYRDLHKDSIPYINSEVKLLQIVAYPPYSDEAVFEVKEKLLELRRRVMEGEDFGTLAILYSEGPSASRRGEIGYLLRSELDPEYAQTAWALKEGQVSKIIETSFGFHIIQLIDRKGDRVNTRHILMKPKADANARMKAINKLDSLKTLIEADSISFEMAAKLHSEDENTSVNGGLIVNQKTNAATFELNDLSTKDYYIVRNMAVGDVSEPYESEDESGKTCYKLLMLKSRTEPHRANLKQDYLLIQSMALQKKHAEVMNKWYKEKRASTYIRIDNSFKHCTESGMTSLK